MTSPYHHYKVLHIGRDASFSDIKKSYRQLALRCHPDKCATAEATAQFQAISRAHEVLSDPERRRQYHNNRGLDKPEIVRDVSMDAQRYIQMFHTGFERGSMLVFASVLSAACISPSHAFGFYIILSTTSAMQAVPRSRRKAQQLTNWFESLGIVLSPLILVSGVALVVYSCGRKTLECSSSRVSPLLEAACATYRYSQSKVQEAKRAYEQYYATNSGPRRTLSEDDFTVLGDSPDMAQRHRRKSGTTPHRTDIGEHGGGVKHQFSQSNPVSTGNGKSSTTAPVDDWVFV